MRAAGLVIALLGILVGVFVGYIFGKHQEASSMAKSETAQLAAPSASGDTDLHQLQAFAQGELADYYRLKTMEERYKKSDEILGKIMLILLADLGVRVSSQTENAIHESANGAHKAEMAAAVAAAYKPAERATTVIGGNSQQAVSPQTMRRAPLEDLRNDHDVDGFLRASRIGDFNETLRTARGFSNATRLLEDVKGKFTGEAKIVQGGKPKMWDIEIRLDGRIEQGKFNGDLKVLMSENGKTFSNKSGTGNLSNDVLEYPSDPRAILFEAAPGTYLQAYFVRRLDAIIANMIEKNEATGTYETIGSMQLRRN